MPPVLEQPFWRVTHGGECDRRVDAPTVSTTRKLDSHVEPHRDHAPTPQITMAQCDVLCLSGLQHHVNHHATCLNAWIRALSNKKPKNDATTATIIVFFAHRHANTRLKEGIQSVSLDSNKHSRFGRPPVPAERDCARHHTGRGRKASQHRKHGWSMDVRNHSRCYCALSIGVPRGVDRINVHRTKDQSMHGDIQQSQSEATP